MKRSKDSWEEEGTEAISVLNRTSVPGAAPCRPRQRQNGERSFMAGRGYTARRCRCRQEKGRGRPSSDRLRTLRENIMHLHLFPAHPWKIQYSLCQGGSLISIYFFLCDQNRWTSNSDRSQHSHRILTIVTPPACHSLFLWRALVQRRVSYVCHLAAHLFRRRQFRRGRF